MPDMVCQNGQKGLLQGTLEASTVAGAATCVGALVTALEDEGSPVVPSAMASCWAGADADDAACVRGTCEAAASRYNNDCKAPPLFFGGLRLQVLQVQTMRLAGLTLVKNVHKTNKPRQRIQSIRGIATIQIAHLMLAHLLPRTQWNLSCCHQKVGKLHLRRGAELAMILQVRR